VRHPIVLLVASLLVVAGCNRDTPGGPRDHLPPVTADGKSLSTTRMFPTKDHPGVVFDHCVYASPIAYDGSIVEAAAGFVVALDPESGAERWRVTLPADDGDEGLVIATPVRVGHLLVVGYQTIGTPGKESPRTSQRVAVVDLDAHALDERFETVELDHTFQSVDGEDVPFKPPNTLGRSELTHVDVPGEDLGRVYVTFGNARDIQPWHGFAFELDLDAWAAGDDAVSGQLVTTKEPDCGTPGHSGARERVCGGGLWAPSGAEVIPRGDSYDLILSPGNGVLDLSREDYANTMMRVGPGLDFDPGCDADACADFDPDDPSDACVTSCDNLYIPRLLPEQEPFTTETGECEGDTMFQCWAKLDYGSGSTPTYFAYRGFHLLAYPLKDGSVSLVDADHLGTLYDRKQLVDVCGTPDDDCRWDWAGMIVTQPALVRDDPPRLLVPTFEPDHTHPAGVVALDVKIEDDQPKLSVAWQAPDFSDPEATTRFREHPSRIRLDRGGPTPVAWVLEAIRSDPGNLLAIDAESGEVLLDRGLVGSGIRFTQPLVDDDRVYVNTCNSDGTAYLEGYRTKWKSN